MRNAAHPTGGFFVNYKSGATSLQSTKNELMETDRSGNNYSDGKEKLYDKQEDRTQICFS